VTRGAHFDRVTKDRLGATLETEEVGAGQRTRSTRRQLGAEHVGDLNEFLLLADRALLAGRATDVVRGTEEFGVSVTEVVATEGSVGEALQQNGPDKAELNNGSVGRGLAAVSTHGGDSTAQQIPRNWQVGAKTTCRYNDSL
jgi:hypothetical protein